MNRRDFLRIGASAVVGSALPDIDSWGKSLRGRSKGLKIIDWKSPKRRTRPNRLSTRHIILHTTEGGPVGALEKLTRRGEANYMVDYEGDVYRIMNPYQVSTGAGRSMWNGRTNLDDHAINIEFAGYHNKSLTPRQLISGKELIRTLQEANSGITDKDVMPHSMVAYGIPNRGYNQSHRGRKRCGMIFAKENVRNALGLEGIPTFDPDVKAKRLIVADRYLESILYRKSSVAETPVEQEEEPERIISTIKKGETPWTYARTEFADSTTTYFLKDGRVRRGDELRKEGFDFKSVPSGTQLAVGYIYGGHIRGDRTAYEVMGRKWNLPSTIYRLPSGDIKTGDEISDGRIPQKTLVLFRK